MGWIKGTARLFGPSIAVGLVAPFIFPRMRQALRPIAKGLIRGGLSVGESVTEAATATRAGLSDLVAEAKAERDREAKDVEPDQSNNS
jgi:Protein of unknown function (DUF5132)